jgi:hypothetical protein
VLNLKSTVMRIYLSPSKPAIVLFLVLLFSVQLCKGQSADSIDNKLNILSNSSAKVATINSSLSTLDSASNKLKKEINDLTRKRGKTRNEMNILQKSIKELEKKQDSMLIKQNELKEETEKLKQSATFLKAQIDTLIKARDTLKSATAKLDTTKKKLAQETLDISKEIEKKQEIISKQRDSMETIATLTMHDSINIWNKGDFVTKTKINRVHINVKEGIIIEIIVITDSGTFRNKSAIIDLLHFGERGDDRLKVERQDYKKDRKYMYIYLDDVMVYAPIRSYLDIPYAEFDIDLKPGSDSIYLLRTSTSINTYFNIAAFTDLKGISGEPNGLAQFTAEAKFITRTKNCPNSSIVPMNYIAFKGGLSKFDNDFKGSQLYNDDSVSRKDLLQRAIYSVGVKMNILRAFPSTYPKHLINDMQLNIGYNFIGAKVFDTVFKDQAHTVIDTNYRNVTQNQFYIEPQMTFNRHKNFSMTIGLPLYANSVKKSSNISNSGWEYWVCPSINLMYYGKRDASSKLFFRYNHFINLKEPSQAFSQMQLGYAVNLTEVWGGRAVNNQ